ncbi:hypothetical protein BSKO_10523 [Bryopsis sp. KO-2023]|nr:hypothetical protein BSKO_10523 [Bryopsis sp. KO-2023]
MAMQRVGAAFAKARAEGGDANAIASAAAREVGEAFAEAWAKAGGASAEAQAEIFGKAIAGAVADAVNGENFAGSAVRAEDVAAAIVRATANVEVKLSTTQGFAKATSEATARWIPRRTTPTPTPTSMFRGIAVPTPTPMRRLSPRGGPFAPAMPPPAAAFRTTVSVEITAETTLVLSRGGGKTVPINPASAKSSLLISFFKRGRFPRILFFWRYGNFFKIKFEQTWLL